MKQPLILLAATVLVFLALNHTLDYQDSYEIGYGAFTLMAAMISLTFLWLWARRATPLAMGMFFGWGGAASIMGWWWIFQILHQPPWMTENPLLLGLLSIYFVGAILHFQVIGRSFGLSERVFIVPVAGSVLVSVLALFFL
ncbi:MAG: hypothetical protein HKN18_13420 [Silicimonas sp.]|nr:hypothetical protein [Silicimonas sp.]